MQMLPFMDGLLEGEVPFFTVPCWLLHHFIPGIDDQIDGAVHGDDR